MRLLFVWNIEIGSAAFGHSLTTRCFRVEMVLTRLPRENFAVLRDFEAFRI